MLLNCCVRNSGIGGEVFIGDMWIVDGWVGRTKGVFL